MLQGSRCQVNLVGVLSTSFNQIMPVSLQLQHSFVRHGPLVRRVVPALERDGQHAAHLGRAALRAHRALRQADVGPLAQLREEPAEVCLVARWS